jgi:hypothetical protein
MPVDKNEARFRKVLGVAKSEQTAQRAKAGLNIAKSFLSSPSGDDGGMFDDDDDDDDGDDYVPQLGGGLGMGDVLRGCADGMCELFDELGQCGGGQGVKVRPGISRLVAADLMRTADAFDDMLAQQPAFRRNLDPRYRRWVLRKYDELISIFTI